jgi:hypothetical protein
MSDEELDIYRMKMAEAIGPYAYGMDDDTVLRYKDLYAKYGLNPLEPAHPAPMPEPKQDDWYYELY